MLAGVALAAVFVVSSIAKLVDRDGTREAVAGFGVPASLAPLVAAALAPVELVVALLILMPATATLGVILALLLLVAFTTAVGFAMAAGRHPDCHCFGRIGAADVSGRTIVRNAVLAGLGVVALAGQARADRPSGGELFVAVALGLLVAALVIAVEGLAGRAARKRRETADEMAFEAGPSGGQHDPVPDIRLPTLGGGDASVHELLRSELPLLLVTLSPGCGSCKKLRPDVAQWANILANRVTVAVVATGSREGNKPSYVDAPHLTVLIDESGELREQLGTTATPSAVLVGPDGHLSSGVANGESLVRRLLVQAITGMPIEAAGVEAPAEDIFAADLDVTSVVSPRPGVEMHDLGESTVLLDTSTGATVVVEPWPVPACNAQVALG